MTKFFCIAVLLCTSCYAGDVANDGLGNQVEQSDKGQFDENTGKYLDMYADIHEEQFGKVLYEDRHSKGDEADVSEKTNTGTGAAGEATDKAKGNENNYVFEYPPLHRVEPGAIGGVLRVELEDGSWFKRTTRAIQPSVFGK